MTDDGQFDAPDDTAPERGGESSVPASDEATEDSVAAAEQDAVAARVWTDSDGFPPGWDDQPLVELMSDRSREEIDASGAPPDQTESLVPQVPAGACVSSDPPSVVTESPASSSPPADVTATMLTAPIDAVWLPTNAVAIHAADAPLDAEATHDVFQQYVPLQSSSESLPDAQAPSFEEVVAARPDPTTASGDIVDVAEHVDPSDPPRHANSDENFDINVDSLPENDHDLVAAAMASDVSARADVEAPEDADAARTDDSAPVVASADTLTPEPEETLDAEADEIDPEPELLGTGPVAGGMWTIPMLCLGIAIIACCVLIPQADYNRRLVYEREKLRRDAEAITEQVKVNDEFLRKLADDPTLAERLAQRQMKIVRQGTRVLDLKSRGYEQPEMSPFHLVTVPPPEPLPPFQSRGGALTQACLNPHTRLYLIGGALVLMASGLVLGYAPRRT